MFDCFTDEGERPHARIPSPSSTPRLLSDGDSLDFKPEPKFPHLATCQAEHPPKPRASLTLPQARCQREPKSRDH
jgi:hypothetical protein